MKKNSMFTMSYTTIDDKDRRHNDRFDVYVYVCVCVYVYMIESIRFISKRKKNEGALTLPSIEM